MVMIVWYKSSFHFPHSTLVQAIFNSLGKRQAYDFGVIVMTKKTFYDLLEKSIIERQLIAARLSVELLKQSKYQSMGP